MNRPGIVLVFSGPAGAGKDTLSNLIIAKTTFLRFPTYTTRAMRPGERDEEHYRFITRESFNELVADGAIFDPVGRGDLYGLPLKQLTTLQASGQSIIVHLVAASAFKLKRLRPEIITALILPPSADVGASRLRRRGMTDEDIWRRVQNEPVPMPGNHDLVVINHENEQQAAVDQILNFVTRIE